MKLVQLIIQSILLTGAFYLFTVVILLIGV